MSPSSRGRQQAGASAAAEYRRRRKAWSHGQRRRVIRGLPVIGIIAAAVCWWIGWHGSRTPALGYAAAAAIVVAWVVGSLTAPSSATAWRAGAEGEQATARLLRPLSRTATILHDRAIPRSKSNLDHIVISRAGLTYLDSKNWQARGARVTWDGRTLMYGRFDHTNDLATVRWEAGRAHQLVSAASDHPFPWQAVMVVHGAPVARRGRLDIDGVTIIEARLLLRFLRKQPHVLSVREAEDVGAAADLALPPKAN